jgi:NitT/TauT family transport system substrate-binding protein
MKTLNNCIATLLLIIVCLSACTPKSTTKALTPITVQLKWLHQAQFAGFYAADQNGYYAAEGLKVGFLEGGPTADLEKPVLDGAAHFGVTDAEKIIAARTEGKPLCAIAVIYRRNPLVFISLADSGITKPEDFVGKTIQVDSASTPILQAMTANVGINPDQYTEVSLPDNLQALESGQVQVTISYITNEVITLREAGYKFNIILPDDYGVHSYADTIITTDDMIKKEPDLVLRFLRATLKGWTYAIENSNMVAPIVAKYNPKADLQHETTQMTASIPLVNTGEDHIGWMKPEIWTGMEQVLRKQGIITAPTDVTRVYTMQFLEESYGK